MTRSLRLGTRRSPLALAQAELVREALARAFDDIAIEIVPLDSEGDLDERPLREFAERGIFAGRLEAALLASEIDAAAHSCKDLRLELPPELPIAAMLEREDPRDALCGPPRPLAALPHRAHVATSSTRRRANLRALRPDLVFEEIRGNVQTRLARTAERKLDGCVLAAAGLARLGLASAGEPIAVTELVPEAAQGAVAIQVRSGSWAADLDWALVDHDETTRAVTIERAAAARLGGGCTVPLGVHVEAAAGRAHLFVADPNGEQSVCGSCTVVPSGVVSEQAERIVRLAESLGALEWCAVHAGKAIH